MRTLIIVIAILFASVAQPTIGAVASEDTTIVTGVDSVVVSKVVDKIWLDFNGAWLGWWVHLEKRWFTQVYAGSDAVTTVAGLKYQVGPVNVQAAIGSKLQLPKGDVKVLNYVTKTLGFWKGGCVTIEYGWEADGPEYSYTNVQQHLWGPVDLRLDQFQLNVIHVPTQIGPVIVYKKGPVQVQIHYGQSFFGPNNSNKKGIKVSLIGQF